MYRLNATAALSAVLLACLVSQACQAYPRRHSQERQIARQLFPNCVLTNDGRQMCGPGAYPTPDSAAAPGAYVTRSRAARPRLSLAVAEGTVIGSRPPGCPHAYCGCGLRLYLGLADPRLNLASNWARFFPRVSGARAGLAAVRAHHVMYLESSAGDGLWMVRDYNSGGGLSRLHVRDLRGYVLVDPRARTAAK